MKARKVKKKVPEKQFTRKTTLTAFGKALVTKKGHYTILGAGIPRNRKDLLLVWKPAIKTALTLMKRRYRIEYILLFEESKSGYKHAHIIITKKEGKKFKKIEKEDLAELRRFLMLFLCRLVFKKSRNFGSNRTVEELAYNLKLDPAKVLPSIKGFFNDEKRFIPSGKGIGFLSYLREKPELLGQDTTISSGLLALRLGKYKNRKTLRTQPKYHAQPGI
jgi:hypothetical protein